MPDQDPEARFREAIKEYLVATGAEQDTVLVDYVLAAATIGTEYGPGHEYRYPVRVSGPPHVTYGLIAGIDDTDIYGVDDDA